MNDDWDSDSPGLARNRQALDALAESPPQAREGRDHCLEGVHPPPMVGVYVAVNLTDLNAAPPLLRDRCLLFREEDQQLHVLFRGKVAERAAKGHHWANGWRESGHCCAVLAQAKSDRHML